MNGLSMPSLKVKSVFQFWESDTDGPPIFIKILLKSRLPGSIIP